MTKYEIENAIRDKLRRDMPTFGVYIFPNAGSDAAKRKAEIERSTTLFIHYEGNDNAVPEYTLSWRIYVCAKSYSTEGARTGAMEAIDRVRSSLDNYAYDNDIFILRSGPDSFLEESAGVWYYIVQVYTKRMLGT